MTIQYFTKSVYGNDMIYLADEASATRWLLLSGRKTITTADMEIISALTGAKFERVFEPATAVA